MAKKNILTRTKKRQAQALFDAHRLNEAEELYLQLSQIDPGDPEVRATLGVIMGQSGRMNEAASYFQKAIALRPDFAEAHYNLGKACKELGQLDLAASSYEAAVRLRPDWPEALNNLGHVLSYLGRMHDAIKCYRRVLAIKPDYAPTYKALSGLLITLGEMNEAMDCIQKLEQLVPGNIDTKVAEAKILEQQGHTDQALAIAQQLYESHMDNLEVDFLYASLCRNNDAITLLEPWLTRSDKKVDTQQRVMLHFKLGDLYDAQDNYQQAFEHYLVANQLKARTYNIEAFSTFVDGLISIFTPEFMSSAPRASHKSSRPIFILGMPRSGTTLVEQILASHPDVFGAGELEFIRHITTELFQADEYGKFSTDCLSDLNIDTCNRLAGTYLEHLKELSAEPCYVTDKMPQNFLGLGIISLLFPKARIIHCRRDPIDTCLSCFFHNFGATHPYAYNLEILGRYYKEYQRIMQHWQEVLGIPMLDVSYEALVADQESMTRALLEYCNLEWNDRCLRFYDNKRTVSTLSYDQVRKPIYTRSIGRWKHYEPYLMPLIESLGFRR